MTEWIISWTIAIVALVGLGLGAIRLLAKDGYGVRPVPASTHDWTAHGLPSRPYGV